mmetsp:Transcript_40979/g.72054  ORF Transcript_40979/g.72054 Transcript_40979/m.72054 type:complete len:83 (+) Transcript_40979:96-344(+)
MPSDFTGLPFPTDSLADRQKVDSAGCDIDFPTPLNLLMTNFEGEGGPSCCKAGSRRLKIASALHCCQARSPGLIAECACRFT